MINYIIFGANGFVGRNFILKNKQDFIFAIISDHNSKDSLNSFLNENKIQRVEILTFDEVLSDYKKFGKLENKIILNLAWKATSGDARRDWNLQFENVITQRKILNFCKNIGCQKYVGFGSIAEKQIYRSLMNNETVNFNSYYALAKYCSHFEATSFCSENKIKLLWLQITNTFGTFENSARLINTILRKIITSQENHEVLEFNFSSGQQLYDFVHIDDCIGLAYKFIETWQLDNEVHLLTSNAPRKFKDYINDIFKFIKCENKINFNESNKVDMFMTKEDYIDDKINNISFYKYRWTFKDAIIDTYMHIKKEKGEK